MHTFATDCSRGFLDGKYLYRDKEGLHPKKVDGNYYIDGFANYPIKVQIPVHLIKEFLKHIQDPQTYKCLKIQANICYPYSMCYELDVVFFERIAFCLEKYLEIAKNNPKLDSNTHLNMAHKAYLNTLDEADHEKYINSYEPIAKEKNGIMSVVFSVGHAGASNVLWQERSFNWNALPIDLTIKKFTVNDYTPLFVKMKLVHDIHEAFFKIKKKKELLSLEFDSNTRGKWGLTIRQKQPCLTPNDFLSIALKKGNAEMVHCALSLGGKPEREALHHACESGYLDVVKELLDANMDINCMDSVWGYTPLHRACLFGRVGIVEELIKRGADIEKASRTQQRSLPLQYAVESKSIDCVKFLLNAGAKKRNYLSLAASIEDYEMVKLLLESGANVKDEPNAVLNAIGCPEVMRLLISYGAAVDHPSFNGYPIQKAAWFGYFDSVKILLNAGANPNSVTKDHKNTALEIAKWVLNDRRTNPQDPPEVTKNNIKELEQIIQLLENLKK